MVIQKNVQPKNTTRDILSIAGGLRTHNDDRCFAFGCSLQEPAEPYDSGRSSK